MAGRQPAEESLLFDLPLDQPARRPTGGAAEQASLPLDAGESPAESAPEPERTASGERPTAAAPPRPEPAPASAPALPSPGSRITAGLLDLGVCLSVLLVLLVALWAMEIRPRAADAPAAALFLLVFSFLYQVLPLAFWRRTPGMALAGLATSTADGQQLTFHQTALRWLGSVLTVLLAGLPLVLMLVGGRSLGDLLSGSVTRRVR